VNLVSAPDLTVIAEIAITLAGFTGLVGILQSRGESELTRLEVFHIANLLMTTVLVVVLAFVPTWIALIPNIGNDVWLWSLRILLVVHLAGWIFITPFIKRSGMQLRDFPVLDRRQIFVLSVLGVIAVIAEAVLVLGFVPEYGPFVYEGVLIFLLCAAMSNFLVLLLRPKQKTPNK